MAFKTTTLDPQTKRINEAPPSNTKSITGSSDQASMEDVSELNDLKCAPNTSTPAQAANTKNEEPTCNPDQKGEGGDTVDHGLVCWLQVVGVFAVWTNAWGVCNAYGEFQTYYETVLHQTPSNIAWVGSLQSFLLLFTGVISGPLSDAGYCRSLLIGGNFLIVLGMMLTSICTRYWQIVICQGLITGFGCGCIFTPGVSILPQYFVKKRHWASGLAASGSGFGGAIFPILIHRLTPQIGFAWAVRVMAFLVLFLGILTVILLRSRLPRRPARQTMFSGVSYDMPLVLYTAGLFFVLLVLYTPVIYIGSFSLHYHITNRNMAFYLVPIVQAAGMLGRAVPTFFADRMGPVSMTIAALAGASIMDFAWMGVRSLASLLVFAILYGTFFGIILGLAPACVASLTDDKTTIGRRTGMSFAIASFGVLIGTPVAGAILGQDRHYIAMQAFVGSFCLLSTLAYIATRHSKVGFGLVAI